MPRYVLSASIGISIDPSVEPPPIAVSELRRIAFCVASSQFHGGPSAQLKGWRSRLAPKSSSGLDSLKSATARRGALTTVEQLRVSLVRLGVGPLSLQDEASGWGAWGGAAALPPPCRAASLV